MKHAVPLLFTAAVALFGIGCTPSPEKTCDKLQELADKEASEKSSGKPFKLDRDKCLKNMNEMKERDAEAYKCTAKVVSKLSNLDTAFLAISVCDKNAPKKSKDEGDEESGAAKASDDEDAPKKKKKKSSDDE